MFNGTDYMYWKTRMRIFLHYMDFNLWNIIESGLKKFSKPMNERNALFYAFDKNEFNWVFNYETAYEI